MRKNKVRTTNLRVLVEVLAELETIGQKRGIRHETFLLWKYHLPKKEKRDENETFSCGRQVLPGLPGLLLLRRQRPQTSFWTF